MKLLSLAARFLRKLMSFLLAASLIMMSISVLIQICMRELFSTSILPLDDVIPYSFSISIFSGTALLFGEEGHVGITIFTDFLPAKIRNAIIVFCRAVVLLFLVYLAYFGYEFMLDGQYQFSPLLNIPLGYIYFVVPLCAVAGLVLIFDRYFSTVPPEEKPITEI